MGGEQAGTLIRVHAAHIGHPIAGDDKYGDAEVNKRLRDQIGLKRLFLHAASLEFALDGGERPYALNAPLAPELVEALERLKGVCISRSSKPDNQDCGGEMFSLLESKEDIAKAQRRLEGTFRREFPKMTVKNIGYPGGTTLDAKVFTDGRYWYWSKDYVGSDVPYPRRLNWFGLFNENTGLNISVEINTTLEGRNDQVAGFFARDNDTSVIYLLHSGRVGGGKKGVGKAALLAWSDQRLIEVVDSSGSIREGVLVMPVEGLAASRSAIRYIDTIVRFKLAVRAGEIDTPEFQRKQKELNDFYAEARGRRKGHRSSEIDYFSRHGDVVDALRTWRELKPMSKSARFVKNTFIDMGVDVAGELVEVFEVKTSTVRPHVYSAIGQLLVHGAADDCRRVIVLPHDEVIADDLRKALQRLDIELLRFKLDEQKATIVDKHTSAAAIPPSPRR